MPNLTYTPDEQAAHRAELVAALRSGDYKQGRTVLRSAAVDEDGKPNKEGGKHCCLGVACDISGLGEWRTTSDEDDEGDTTMVYQVTKHDREAAILPLAVAEYFGFATVVGDLSADGVRLTRATTVERETLTEMNDAGVDFADIAGMIEDGLIEVAE